MSNYQNLPKTDELVGRCWHCRVDDVELDVDTAECDNCIKQYALEQEMIEK